MAEPRISYSAGLQRLIDRVSHALDCPQHALDQRWDLPCECGFDADIALGRSLAALVERVERLAVQHNESVLTKGGARFELSEIALALAAGFDPSGGGNNEAGSGDVAIDAAQAPNSTAATVPLSPDLISRAALRKTVAAFRCQAMDASEMKQEVLAAIDSAVAGEQSPTDTARLATENSVRRLQQFAARVMREHRNDGYVGDVDGGELQDIALACGLIEEREMQEPCHPEVCVCADISDFPLTCYRDTALMRECYRADTDGAATDSAPDLWCWRTRTGAVPVVCFLFHRSEVEQNGIR